MQRSHVLGMICGYFLSRFDRRAYERLGYPNQQAAHDALGAALDVPSESIKNWRDEFDPVHDNPRRGWHRREMNPSRRRTIEALGDRSEDELYGLVMAVMADPAGRSADQLVQAIDDPNAQSSGVIVETDLRKKTGKAYLYWS